MNTLTGIINDLQELQDNCICDFKSEWVKTEEKAELQINLNILISAIGNLRQLKANNCKTIFNNIHP